MYDEKGPELVMMPAGKPDTDYAGGFVVTCRAAPEDECQFELLLDSGVYGSPALALRSRGQTVFISMERLAEVIEQLGVLHARGVAAHTAARLGVYDE